MKRFNIKFMLPVLMAVMVVCLSCKEQPAGGISFFSGTLKEALKKAKAEKKHVFFDAYASWCGPCKTMEREVFSNKTIGDYFNQNFISIRIDMEKGEGPDVAKIYTSIDGYPSLLFLDGEGHVIKTLLGSRNTEDFLAEAKLVK